ncbi:hypothetical protein [Umezawaea sp. Da 62-37]|uniref:hypothetical protein n=1 Tax=Umezawaea sp. Da 62-37 TaxID=3075927 RepID=UPI0028F71EB6|nr:hypothetical protein [Umezawaea sp. Da 62-37]WNV86659.1 hypothetical protein RM788_52530 [Umezawaea sp. Da 62-37]WNV86758.1 hypothetical protein RM788_00275 [Umezawaea sp. Da 62-37]
MTSKGPVAALATPVGPFGSAHAESDQQQASREFAERLGAKRRKAGAPVRTAFVIAEEDRERPPMAELLSSATGGGGGRGGQLRLKLYLSLLWVCAKEPYEAIRPARAWAALLGLDDIENRGARRIHSAIHDLVDRDLARVRDRGGQASAVRPLSDRGNARKYEPPSETYNRFKQKGAGERALQPHRYFRLPSGLWTAGHIAALSGPALAMLLVVRCEQRGNENTPVWFSPKVATERYGLAESTRVQGLQQLRDRGLLTTETRSVSESGAFIDQIRRRNVHTLNLTELVAKA